MSSLPEAITNIGDLHIFSLRRSPKGETFVGFNIQQEPVRKFGVDLFYIQVI